MKLLSQAQMREMDHRTIEGGTPGLELMERAGRGILRSLLLRSGALASLPGHPTHGHSIHGHPGHRDPGRFLPSLHQTAIWILCGKGNNGGDGLVLARLLRNRGLHPVVWMSCRPEELTGDAAAQVDPVVRSGVLLKSPSDSDWVALRRQWGASRSSPPGVLVVDALLGTGLQGPARGVPGEWIERLAELKAGSETGSQGGIRGGLQGGLQAGLQSGLQSGLQAGCKARVLAIDIPSGSSGDIADVDGPSVRADWTVTMSALKRSFPFPPVRQLAGPVDVVDIGIPSSVEERVGADAELVSPRMASEWVPRPEGRDHKGRWGRLLIAGGAPGMTGAPTLAARAAQRMGAGLIRVCTPASLAPWIETAVTEAMTVALPEGEDGQALARGAERILADYGSWHALVVGPGLGRFPDTDRFVLKLLGGWRGPLVIDADGLNVLADWGPDSWVPRAREIRAANCPGGLVLTPHYGEMERLTGRPKKEWSDDPITMAREWATRWGVTLALKGAPTVTAAPDGRVWVNGTGHYGLGSGGSGDVLSGIIGTLLAQGLDGPGAATLGSHLHGLAAECATPEDPRSLRPTDVIDGLPEALRRTLACETGPNWRWTQLP